MLTDARLSIRIFCCSEIYTRPRGDGLCGPERMRDHGHVADQR